MILIEFNKEELIKSPLNYTGGKYKLLPQILPLIPNEINTFVDLFCGGLDVSLNINANKIICNDIINPMIYMYNEFKNQNLNEIFKYIDNQINKYNLNKENKKGYLEFRDYYNKNKNPLDLIILISHCYNNQIRFNSKWDFNRAFGERTFNEIIQNNLKNMINIIQNNNIQFYNYDYIEFLNKFHISDNDFIYVDPPYLITYADYSIQAKWNEEKEIKLLNKLDELNDKNIKFALSNVLQHDNKINNILIEWSKKYNIHYLNYNYNNSNSDKKIKNGKSVEVLITNNQET